MQKPISINLEQLDWQAHPSIAGIQTKFFQNSQAFPPLDLLIATVSENCDIPWHVHETDSELAYVLQGTGILQYAADEAEENPEELPLPKGAAVIVPPNVWHYVRNIGNEDLLLFAAHMHQNAP